MAGIVKTRGTLYFLRDMDNLTGEKSIYVKIGIVNKDRTTGSRMKDHQTGNPRAIVSEHILEDVPFIRFLEKYLHYFYNDRRISGEWFVMDNDFLEKDVLKEAKRIRKEQLKFENDIYLAEKLSTQISNEESRKANKAELKLRDDYNQLMLDKEIANANVSITRSALLQAIGKVGFVDGVYHLTKAKDSITFDSTKFKNNNKILYDTYCFEKEGGFHNKFIVLGGEKLKKADEPLYNKVKDLPKEAYKETMISKVKKRSTKIETLHWNWMKAMRESKLLEWEEIKLDAQLKVAIGHYNQIDEVCTWERKPKDPTLAFNKDLLKQDHPQEYLNYLTVKIGAVNPKLEPTRAYPF